MVLAIVAVLIIGLLHGLEPGHGWPIALFYATSKKKPMLQGLLSSSLMAGAHFASSIVAVVVYVVVIQFVPLPLKLLKYAASAILIVLAVRFWLEGTKRQHGHVHETLEKLEHTHEHSHAGLAPHNHEHTHQAKVVELKGLVGLAFVIGFAHEEEFALLALAVGGVDPLMLMVSYAVAVTVSLVAVTLVSIRAYARFREKLAVFEKYTPRITALILLGLAGAFLLDLA